MENQLINKILENYLKKIPDIDYFVVANTLKPNNDCSLAHASTDELFSRTEFAEIASAIFDDFGFVNVFYSEQEFIKYIINNNLSREIFVFNYARNGNKEGKKSLIPAFCDLYKIKYSGSNAFVISLLRNKFVCGNLLSKFGIPIPESCIFESGRTYIGDVNALTGKKVIAKNICESASMDLSDENIFIFNEKIEHVLVGLINKINRDKILLQRFIDGKECEVLVLRDGNEFHAMQPVEIILNGRNFIDTQTSNSYNYRFCNLEESFDANTVNKIKGYAEYSAKILNIKDYARFDFRIDQHNNMYLIDIAGTPYTIKHSSITYLFTSIYNYDYKEIYKCLAGLSYHNYLAE